MENIKEYVLSHIRQIGGDIINAEFPLSKTYGEGFSFEYNGKKYITRGITKKGKRVCTFFISTFVGLCGGARHYYCRMSAIMQNGDETDITHSICGYMGGVEIPLQNRTLEWEICHILTEEDIKKDPCRYEYCKPGDTTNAFEDKNEIYQIIEQFKKAFVPGEWEIQINE